MEEDWVPVDLVEERLVQAGLEGERREVGMGVEEC